MKRSSKRLVITSEKKNAQGFRVRNTGIDLSDFTSNPLLLWMHKRPTGNSKDEILPLGYWEDVRWEDGKLTGIPVFDEDDPFAMQILGKVEKGIIKMASAGLQPFEWKMYDDELWLDTSVMKEASMVDIGSNSEAIEVALYDHTDRLIELSDNYTQILISNITNMELINLSAAELGAKLKLEKVTPELAMAKIAELVTLADSQAGVIDSLTADKTTAEQAKAEAEQKYNDLVKLQDEQKIETLVQGAVDARKITADQKENYVKLATADFEVTKATLDAMKTQGKVADEIKKAEGAENKLVTLSYEELDKKGLLAKLKADNLEVFKAKFKEKFGRDYQA